MHNIRQDIYAAVFQLYLEGRNVVTQFTLLTHFTRSNSVTGGQPVKGVNLSLYVKRRAKKEEEEMLNGKKTST